MHDPQPDAPTPEGPSRQALIMLAVALALVLTGLVVVLIMLSANRGDAPDDGDDATASAEGSRLDSRGGEADVSNVPEAPKRLAKLGAGAVSTDVLDAGRARVQAGAKPAQPNLQADASALDLASPPDVSSPVDVLAGATSDVARDTAKPQTMSIKASASALEALTACLNRAHPRALQSYAYYHRWMKHQPPDCKNTNYALYEVYTDATERCDEAIETARLLAPHFDHVTDEMEVMHQKFTVLAPLTVEANQYFEAQLYLTDDCVGAIDIDARLEKAFVEFLAAAKQARNTLLVERHDMDQRVLEIIKNESGENGEWHVRNVLRITRHLMNVLPMDGSALPASAQTLFSARATKFHDAVDVFGAWTREHPEETKKLDVADIQGKLMLLRKHVIQLELAIEQGKTNAEHTDELWDAWEDVLFATRFSNVKLPMVHR